MFPGSPYPHGELRRELRLAGAFLPAPRPGSRYARNVEQRVARYGIGQVVRHRIYSFRGVVFDIDPVFDHTEEWWLSIPEKVRPRKDQPYYHLLAENDQATYVAYVSEQNLEPDPSGEPIGHPQVPELFGALEGGFYEILERRTQ